MAIRLMTGNRLRVGANNLGQKFKYLLVMDFEATCEKDIAIETPEIIEFPCMALNTKNWEVENVFHKYVKPRVNPILSPYCTDLTGIMQETIEDEQHFPEVFESFCKWLETNDFVKNTEESAFVTCGNWDFKVMLPSQCALDQLAVPHHMKQWIDLKKAYCSAMQYYPRSLRDMLKRLDLPPQGRLHSGLSDTHNMTRIIRTLANKYHVKYDFTSS